MASKGCWTTRRCRWRWRGTETRGSPPRRCASPVRVAAGRRAWTEGRSGGGKLVWWRHGLHDSAWKGVGRYLVHPVSHPNHKARRCSSTTPACPPCFLAMQASWPPTWSAGGSSFQTAATTAWSSPIWRVAFWRRWAAARRGWQTEATRKLRSTGRRASHTALRCVRAGSGAGDGYQPRSPHRVLPHPSINRCSRAAVCICRP